MKQELKENGGLPAHILWTLAIVAGVSVANLYYNQPLLNIMRHELEVSEFKTNLIAMITQIGYALGLLFIVPLGDLYRRKNIILTNFFLLIFSLLAIAMAPNIYIIWAASLITGICSMIPQYLYRLPRNSHAPKTGTECRCRHLRITDWNTCITCCQRIVVKCLAGVKCTSSPLE